MTMKRFSKIGNTHPYVVSNVNYFGGDKINTECLLFSVSVCFFVTMFLLLKLFRDSLLKSWHVSAFKSSLLLYMVFAKSVFWCQKYSRKGDEPEKLTMIRSNLAAGDFFEKVCGEFQNFISQLLYNLEGRLRWLLVYN